MELWCAVEIGRDFDLFVFCLSKQHTKFLQGKEVKFFSKAFENKSDCVAFLCASLFLTLSLLSFLYALFSPMTRRRIIARDSSSSSSSSSTSSSKARPFPTLLGKFYY